MEYKISTAAYTGRRHQAAGLPGQDHAAQARSSSAVCAALADGAGSRICSSLGAACVTEHISRLLSENFDRIWEREDLADYLVQECVRVLSEQEPPIYELASTLLFFAGHRDGRFLSGNLGDGMQILINEDDASVFSPPENGEYRNETFFITAADAPAHLRLRRGRLETPGALLLMSDGMAESLYQRGSGTPALACRVMAGWLREGDEDTVSQALADNMRRVFSQHSGDDLSLAAIAWE